MVTRYSRLAGVFLAVSAVVLAGCGERAAEQPESDPLVSYTRGGGIAGVPERLVIQTDGTATVEAGYEPTATDFRLGDAELEQLRTELDAADLEGVEDPQTPSTCADCFVYEIVYGGVTVGYDEANPPAESVTAVVAHLGQIAADHQPPTGPGSPAG
jgi:hypothetical protein